MKRSFCFPRPLSYTLVLPFLLFSSCFVPRYRLSEREEAFIARQKNVCDIWIHYDNKAIRHLDSNGIYRIECHERKATLQSQAGAIAKAMDMAGKLVPIMNFKDHHRYIYVELTGTDNSRTFFSIAMEYSCTVGIPVADVGQAFIVEQMKWIPQSMLRTRVGK